MVSREVLHEYVKYRAKRIYGYIKNRIKKQDEELIELFYISDLTIPKVINLIVIFKSD